MGGTDVTHPSQGMISLVSATRRLWTAIASLCLPAPCPCSRRDALDTLEASIPLPLRGSDKLEQTCNKSSAHNS